MIKKIKLTIGIWKVLILFLPVFFLCGETLLPDLFVKRQMGGYTEAVSFPEINSSNWINGGFQEEFEQWWNASYGLRSYIIPAYNQFRYSVFGLTIDSLALGQGRSIQRVDDINDALQLRGLDYNQDYANGKMTEYASQIVTINDSLENIGVKTLYYLTPSKAHWEYDKLPLRYKLQAKKGSLDGADLLADLLKDTNVPFLDCREEIRNNKDIPVYYKTGVHWSAIIEQKMIVWLLSNISTLSEKQTGQIILKDIEESSTPYYRDADGYSLLNIYKGIMDEKYYLYDYDVVPSSDQPINILISGGSYNDGFINYCVDNNLLNGGDLYFVSYSNYVTRYDGKTGEKETTLLDGDFNNYDFNAILSGLDIVIFEGNDGTGVPIYSTGFVDYIYGMVTNNGI